MRYITALAALAVASIPAFADEVVLRNGARFEGDVRESKDTVTVVMDFGSITFKRIDVARIDRGPAPILVFDGRLVLLKADDLEGRFDLAMWALDRHLDQRATKLLEHILERDPDHARAREALGYRRHQGKWLTEEEYFTEQGLVKCRGEWMKKEIVREILRIEAEQEAEIARQVELEVLRARVAEAEEAAAIAQEDAARAQAEAESYADSYYRPVFFYRWTSPAVCTPKRPIFMGNAAFLPGRCPPAKPAPVKGAPAKSPASFGKK